MIAINQSVGKKGVNFVKDLRLVQCALFELKFLSKKDFINECLRPALLNPLNELEESIQNNPVFNTRDFFDITEGNFKINENTIPKTIAAISTFQKEKLGIANPDGRIDPGGRSISQLSKLYEANQKAKNPNLDPFNIAAEGDKLTITLKSAGKEATKILSVSACRQFIESHYNLNGMMKLMRAVFEACDASYAPPANLTGNVSDLYLILPVEGIKNIVALQLRQSLKNNADNAKSPDALLLSVDGMPGESFIKKQLQKPALVDFLDETGNVSMKKTADGSTIKIPSLDQEAAVLYDFFRDLVNARNGLWSDAPGVTNLVGLRRVLNQMNQTAYNDTLAVCFLEADETGVLQKKAELHIASTEPGNRVLDRQLVPQTLIVLPGFHNIRQPAGRTRNAVKQGKNKGALVWNPGDTTMNFHQGANNFNYPGNTANERKLWLMKYGIDTFIQTGQTKTGWDAKTLLDLNKTLSEIYWTLSKYGGDGTKAPYQNLQTLAGLEQAENQGLSDGKVFVKKGSGAGKIVKEIEIAPAKLWTVNYWFGKRSKAEREKFTDILQKLEIFDAQTILSWEAMDRQKVVEAISDEHIKAVVDLQIEHLADINQIDGKPGQTFVELIYGIHPSLSEAKTDKTRMDELLKSLENFPLKNIADLQSKLKTSLLISTTKNRQRIFQQSKKDPRTKAEAVENATVGPYSQGCQIIFDTEVFYKFWSRLLQNAGKVGQTRWYYTLIDATDFKPGEII